MAKNSTIPKIGITNLTVIRTREKDSANARLIPIKRQDKKKNASMPPEREQYIKVKKHDFL